MMERYALNHQEPTAVVVIGNMELAVVSGPLRVRLMFFPAGASGAGSVLPG